MSQYYKESLTTRLRRKAVLIVSLSIIWCVMAGFAVAQGAEEQGVKKDCQCRAPDGQMRDLGTVECVDIVGNKKLVRCEMSTNTPYWKNLEGVEGCPAA